VGRRELVRPARCCAQGLLHTSARAVFGGGARARPLGTPARCPAVWSVRADRRMDTGGSRAWRTAAHVVTRAPRSHAAAVQLHRHAEQLGRQARQLQLATRSLARACAKPISRMNASSSASGSAASGTVLSTRKSVLMMPMAHTPCRTEFLGWRKRCRSGRECIAPAPPPPPPAGAAGRTP
jgi:hypothetical protein